MSDDGNGRRIKTLAVEWATKQGVSTVLLMILIGILAYGWPRHIERIQAGYDRQREDFKQAIDTIMEGCREERQATMELLRELRARP